MRRQEKKSPFEIGALHGSFLFIAFWVGTPWAESLGVGSGLGVALGEDDGLCERSEGEGLSEAPGSS